MVLREPVPLVAAKRFFRIEDDVAKQVMATWCTPAQYLVEQPGIPAHVTCEQVYPPRADGWAGD